MRSMTGYGRGECLLHDRKAVVEIKSVNHRYNDLTIKSPRMMNGFEDRLRKQLSAYIQRGKTDVYISLESFSTDDVKINVNETLAAAYINALSRLEQKFALGGGVTLSLVAAFHDVISIDKHAADETALAEIWEVTTQSVQMALAQLTAMRETEGASLKSDILTKLEDIEQAMAHLKARAPLVAEAYGERLRTRMTELLDGAAIDEAKLLTEVAVFAERACIDEEITRFYSHMAQMRDITGQSGAIGRKLDFLVQEMNREVNTMGAKSNDADTTKIIIDLKSALEKIREQVQNIE